MDKNLINKTSHHIYQQDKIIDQELTLDTNKILFFISADYQVTEITYNDVTNVLSKLGGIYTAIYSMVGILITYLLYKDWRNSILQQIMCTPEFQ